MAIIAGSSAARPTTMGVHFASFIFHSGRSPPLVGGERVARFLIEVTRKRPDAWWRKDFRPRLGPVNGLPAIIVESPEGGQTTAFEIEGDVIRALYVVRNPDKLRRLARFRE